MTDAERKQAVFKAIREKYSPEDLDEHVQEIFLLKAGEINNGGIDAQLEFLAHESSLAWLEEMFLSDD